jgi:predicted negative regulator of RcsB-dependent stress response
VEVYTTEEQQVEAIRKWWHDNKWSIIGGVIIGLAALWGGRTYLEGQRSYGEAASAAYQIMMSRLDSGATKEAAQIGAQLLGQFADTPYAGLAALAMAKIKVEAGDLVAAKSQLHWALDNSKQVAVQHEARLRLGRILLAEGKGSEALALLNGVDEGSYKAAYEELKGDIHVHDGDAAAARQAYALALAALKAGAPARQVIQMKLDDLGGAS